MYFVCYVFYITFIIKFKFSFADLMTEMMDLSSDVGGPGIPFLDYRTYAERVFFPGQKGAPLSKNLDLPDSRRQTVEQGLGQLNNLLNNRLFLIRVSETLSEFYQRYLTVKGKKANEITMFTPEACSAHQRLMRMGFFVAIISPQRVNKR